MQTYIDIYMHTHMKIIFSNHKYVLGIGKMEMCHQKGNALCPEVGSSKSSLGRAGPRGVLTLLWSKVSNLTSLLSYLTCKTGNSLFQGCCRTDNSIYKVCLEQEQALNKRPLTCRFIIFIKFNAKLFRSRTLFVKVTD